MSKKLKSQFICSSMMLPEHVTALNDAQRKAEDKELFNIPEIDEQQFELWDSLLWISKIEGKKLKINYIAERGPASIKGVILEMNQKTININSGGSNSVISIKNIISIDYA